MFLKTTPVVFVLLMAAAALAQMGPATVVVAPVERRNIDLTSPLVASVEPVTRTTLAAEQGGLVSERLFDEGQWIEKGAVLTRVNTDLLKLQHEAARAAAEALAAQVQEAQAQLENAKRELDRRKQLFEQQVAPEKEYLDALSEYQMATAALGARKAQGHEKQAEAERLALMIAKSETQAPIGGVVGKRYVEVGQWIEQGDPVADLVQLDPLFVIVNVPEQVLPRVKRGDEARITIDALGGQTFTGKVDQILPEADPTSRTFRVKLLLPNPQLSVRPGFFARAVLVSTSDSALVVPRDAVVYSARGAHVVVNRNGVAEIVPVQAGTPAADGKVAVTPMAAGALNVGDPVVTRGNEGLRPGQALAPAEGGPPATREP